MQLRGLDDFAELVFAAIAVAISALWIGAALLLWLTKRDNRAAAWVVLASQVLPLGLFALVLALSARLFDGPLGIVAGLLAAGVALFSWLAIARLRAPRLPGPPEKIAAPAAGPVSIRGLVPLWGALELGGAIGFAVIRWLAIAGRVPESAVQLLEALVVGAVALAQWLLLRRAGVGPAWIAGTVAADFAATRIAPQLALRVGAALGASSSMAALQLLLWSLVAGGLVGLAQLFCLPERFVLRTRWPLILVGANVAGAIVYLVASKLVPPALEPALSSAIATLYGVLCGAAMKAILATSRAGPRELTLAELIGESNLK